MSMTEFDPIWTLREGDILQARTSLNMEDGEQERVFTEGRRYTVVRILPVRMPPAAVVIDDAGHENKIEASFLVNFIHVTQ